MERALLYSHLLDHLPVIPVELVRAGILHDARDVGYEVIVDFAAPHGVLAVAWVASAFL